MKERPILFNAEMVRAVLDGRKTQTRRIRGLDEINKNPDVWIRSDLWDMDVSPRFNFLNKNLADEPFMTIGCPYGVPGDRLWVRETFGRNGCGCCPIHFRATEPDWLNNSSNPSSQWFPPLHMSRGLSRINLEIVSVRVERVQDISEDDAKAEGCSGMIELRKDELMTLPQHWFANLWDSINEKKGFGWDMNPWVWVIEFKEVK